MGISSDSMHKRRATGGKKAWRKKRNQPALSYQAIKTVGRVRVRGGNVKWRALRLDTGNYSWVDAAPFKQWYLKHYGVDIGRKKKTASKKDSTEEGEALTEETEK
ncbi:hypothetical protein L6164_003113 [Bauhinia variegata]|uniref:Uncharacterized protein n=1 Tax=Bauhinia variegata TaxID=167791 RepID=A0ACB9Q306_BAUVA|nr:hypothetical protein L6164_003113 [Bauhinia variegata]